MTSHMWDALGPSRVSPAHAVPLCWQEGPSGLSPAQNMTSRLSTGVRVDLFPPGRRGWRQTNRNFKYLLALWGSFCSKNRGNRFRKSEEKASKRNRKSVGLEPGRPTLGLWCHHLILGKLFHLSRPQFIRKNGDGCNNSTTPWDCWQDQMSSAWGCQCPVQLL